MSNVFIIDKTLKMSPYDFADLDARYYTIKMLTYDAGDRSYRIICNNLKYLIEALNVFNYNDHIATLMDMERIVVQSGKITDEFNQNLERFKYQLVDNHADEEDRIVAVCYSSNPDSAAQKFIDAGFCEEKDFDGYEAAFSIENSGIMFIH